MPVRPYLSPIIGTGTDADPYRPKVATYPVAWAAVIAGQPNGAPKLTWSLVLVNAPDLTALEADADLLSIPGSDMSTTISSLGNQTRNRIQSGLNSRNITVTVTNYATVGELVTAIGQAQDPNFSLASLRVAG